MLVHSYYLGKPSPSVTIENGVNLGLTGGHPDPLELTFQIAVDRHPGYTVKKRTAIEMEAPDYTALRMAALEAEKSDTTAPQR